MIAVFVLNITGILAPAAADFRSFHALLINPLVILRKCKIKIDIKHIKKFRKFNFIKSAGRNNPFKKLRLGAGKLHRKLGPLRKSKGNNVRLINTAVFKADILNQKTHTVRVRKKIHTRHRNKNRTTLGIYLFLKIRTDKTLTHTAYSRPFFIGTVKSNNQWKPGLLIILIISVFFRKIKIVIMPGNKLNISPLIHLYGFFRPGISGIRSKSHGPPCVKRINIRNKDCRNQKKQNKERNFLCL